ncbi:hypothetical protein AAFC00_002198 [Neodothiora populina]
MNLPFRPKGRKQRQRQRQQQQHQKITKKTPTDQLVSRAAFLAELKASSVANGGGLPPELESLPPPPSAAR